MISLGSDTGGSVRQPADWCGVYGFKPSYGRISRYGLIAYASSFDAIGIFAHSVADIAAVYQQIAGPDPMDSTCLQEPLPPFSLDGAASEITPRRFAVLAPTMELPGLDPEIRQRLEALFSALRQQGHTVDYVPFDLLDYIVPAYYVLTTAEASSNLNRYDGVRYGHRSAAAHPDLTAFYKQNRSEGFGPEVKRRIMLGSFVLSAGYFDAYFTKAQQVRRLITRQTAAIFRHYDAILMPVSPTTALPLGQQTGDPVAMYLADIYTVFANLAGIPGMAIPLFRHANGLPFGIQVLTNRGEEVPLHSISQYLSEAV
jgi:aspartyl-tRNA(Asn)/glutamyl-tRNA(Gln) amidotransferase subunit A